MKFSTFELMVETPTKLYMCTQKAPSIIRYRGGAKVCPKPI